MGTLWYSNLLAGIVRGAFEQVQMRVKAVFTKDVLHGDQMAVAAHAIGPSRTLVQLCHARHDVFVSADKDVVSAALQYLRTWLVSQGFHARSRAPSSPDPPAAKPRHSL